MDPKELEELKKRLNEKLEGLDELKARAAQAVTADDLAKTTADIDARVKQGIEELRKSIPAGQTTPIFDGGDATGSVTPRQRDELNKKLRAIILNPTEARSMGMTTGGNGGFLVPDQALAVIAKRADALEVVGPNCNRSLAGAGISGSIGVEKGGFSFTVVGESKTVTGQTADNLLGRMKWSQAKLMSKVDVSRDLIANANMDVLAYVSDLFGRALANTRDELYTNGSGSGRPEGFLVNVTDVNSVAQAGANLAYDDLINMFFALKAPYRGQSIWQMPTSALKLVAKIKDGNGRPIFTKAEELAGVANLPANLFGFLLGRPLFENARMADGKIVLGDFAEYYYAIGGQNMEIRSSEHAAFDTDDIRVQAIVHLDGKKAFGEPFAQLTGVK